MSNEPDEQAGARHHAHPPAPAASSLLIPPVRADKSFHRSLLLVVSCSATKPGGSEASQKGKEVLVSYIYFHHDICLSILGFFFLLLTALTQQSSGLFFLRVPTTKPQPFEGCQFHYTQNSTSDPAKKLSVGVACL